MSWLGSLPSYNPLYLYVVIGIVITFTMVYALGRYPAFRQWAACPNCEAEYFTAIVWGAFWGPGFVILLIGGAVFWILGFIRRLGERMAEL